jgi:hypothetical protein
MGHGGAGNDELSIEKDCNGSGQAYLEVSEASGGDSPPSSSRDERAAPPKFL